MPGSSGGAGGPDHPPGQAAELVLPAGVTMGTGGRREVLGRGGGEARPQVGLDSPLVFSGTPRSPGATGQPQASPDSCWASGSYKDGAMYPPTPQLRGWGLGRGF